MEEYAYARQLSADEWLDERTGAHVFKLRCRACSPFEAFEVLLDADCYLTNSFMCSLLCEPATAAADGPVDLHFFSTLDVAAAAAALRKRCPAATTLAATLARASTFTGSASASVEPEAASSAEASAAAEGQGRDEGQALRRDAFLPPPSADAGHRFKCRAEFSKDVLAFLAHARRRPGTVWSVRVQNEGTLPGMPPFLPTPDTLLEFHSALSAKALRRMMREAGAAADRGVEPHVMWQTLRRAEAYTGKRTYNSDPAAAVSGDEEDEDDEDEEAEDEDEEDEVVDDDDDDDDEDDATDDSLDDDL